MFVSADEFNKAVSRIATLAVLENKQPGIALEIKDGSIDLFYNGDGKAIINTINATVGEDEFHGKIVFDFKKLVDTANYCKSSGRIKVNSVEIQINRNPDNTGTARFFVTKFMERYDAESNESKQSVVATNTYDLVWVDVENTTGNQRKLKNVAYSDMFEDKETEVWNIEDLANMVGYASSCGAKNMYSIKTYQGMFAHDLNSAFSVFVKSETEFNTSLNLQTSQAKAIVSIIKSLDNVEDINISTLRKDDGSLFAFLFFTADKKLSIYMAAQARSSTMIASVNKYVGAKYNKYNFNILTEVLIDTLKAHCDLSAIQDGVISFVKTEDGDVVMKITAENTNSSTNNNYEIKCDSFNSMENIPNGTNIISIKPNIKNLLTIVSNNKQDFTAFDIEIDADDKVIIRIGCIDTNKSFEIIKELARAQGLEIKATPVPVVGATEQTELTPAEEAAAMEPSVVTPEEPEIPTSVFDAPEAKETTGELTDEDLIKFISNMTAEDKMNIRADYLIASYYANVNKV